MGLFDIFKGSSEKKSHKCFYCGKVFSGFLSGFKLSDGEYICAECFPQPTRLMKQENALNKNFSLYGLSSQQMNSYLEYRKQDSARAKNFTPTETYLDGQILVDRPNMWFKLSAYEEVFHIQQIHALACTAVKDGNKYKVALMISLKNKIYSSLIFDYTFRSTALLRSNQSAELASFLADFHKSFCPNAIYIFS